ncbi:hypothetical protein MNEG_0642, partial [Monoraphidium neglectum]
AQDTAASCWIPKASSSDSTDHNAKVAAAAVGHQDDEMHSQGDATNSRRAGKVSRRSSVGVLLDASHPQGVSPVHVAAAAGRADVIERLMLIGCDPNQRSWIDLPLSEALQGALSGDCVANIKGLSTGSSGDSHASGRFSMISSDGSGRGCGAFPGSVETQPVPCPLLLPADALHGDALLSGGVPLAAGVTPLQVAAAAGHVAAVEALLCASGTDVNSRTAQGLTALHLAAHFGHA